MHSRHRREDRIGVEPSVMRRALELEREHVEQHLRIGVGVDVTKIELEKLALQRLAVGEIAVVRQCDSERRIHIERLRLEVGPGGAGGRIAAMAYAGIAQELAHVARTKDIA